MLMLYWSCKLRDALGKGKGKWSGKEGEQMHCGVLLRSRADGSNKTPPER